MMNLKTIALTSLALFAAPAFADDSYFDGSEPLLCTLMTTQLCDYAGCATADRNADLNGVKHVVLDFERDRVKSPESGLEAEIAQVEQVDNRLFVQGINDADSEQPDARSWTMTIADPNGTMTLTVAGEEVAIVAFGACAPVK
jgi:hypothetical protein